MIKQNLIFINQPFRNRSEVISFIASKADEANLLTDQHEFIKTVLRRESEISTSIGYAIAIPHGKTDAVKEAFIAYATVKKPFEWDSDTKDRVKAIFLIGVPKKNTDKLHLKAISEVSKKLINDEFRKKLFDCETNEDAFSLLNSINREF